MICFRNMPPDTFRHTGHVAEVSSRYRGALCIERFWPLNPTNSLYQANWRAHRQSWVIALADPHCPPKRTNFNARHVWMMGNCNKSSNAVKTGPICFRKRATRAYYSVNWLEWYCFNQRAQCIKLGFIKPVSALSLTFLSCIELLMFIADKDLERAPISHNLNYTIGALLIFSDFASV